MGYEVVNEKLNIKACSVADLTLQQALGFLKQWESDTPIGKLTLFYDNSGALILNRDSEAYPDCLVIAESFLQLDSVTAAEYVERAPESMKMTMKMMYECLKKRLHSTAYEIIEADKLFFPDVSEMEVLEEIKERKQGYNTIWPMVDAFHYGFIQGKRYERARKAKRTKSEPRKTEEKENV